MTQQPELAVVMPIFNEEAAIERVVRSWRDVLDQLSIDWRMHLYDDGSRDGTLTVIKRLAADESRIVVHHQQNRGHGPTVIRAYRDLAHVPWLFQVDSDDEVPPQAFGELWRRRSQFDFLIGERVYQSHARPAVRGAISFVSRCLVQLLFGPGVRDVNVPYRLLRTDAFTPLFAVLPDNLFSPNIIMSGFAVWADLKIYRLPISYQFRQSGEVSIRRGKLLRAALKSLWQTVWFRLTALRSLPRGSRAAASL
jgi:glycosyltransferase involved in cell wall biosynthesis